MSPSPTVGYSGDRCHSPSTKNLISYLYNIKLLVQKKKMKKRKSTDTVEWHLPGLSINVVENLVKEPVYSGDNCSP